MTTEEYQEAIQWAVEALSIAVQLAEVASDWHLDEVEIDGVMLSIYDVKNVLRSTLKQLEELP